MNRDDFFEKWGILANDHNQYHPEYREKIKQNFMEALDAVISYANSTALEKAMDEVIKRASESLHLEEE